MANAKQPYKNSLSIRLAESVIFLRADPSGRNRNLPDAPPAVLRGLLTLTLVKPTKISSIEVELVCKTSTAWPEGMFLALVICSSLGTLGWMGVGFVRFDHQSGCVIPLFYDAQFPWYLQGHGYTISVPSLP